MAAEHPWWHSKYNIRYQLNIPARAFPDDNKIIVRLDDGITHDDVPFKDSYKVRSDFEDLEVLYLDENNTWHILPRLIETLTADDDLTYTNVKFNRYSNITSASDRYYIYTGNPQLKGVTHLRPQYYYDGYFQRPGFPDIQYDSGLSIISPLDSSSPPETEKYKGFWNHGNRQLAIPGTSPRFTVSNPTEDWNSSGLSQKQGARASFIYSGEPSMLIYEVGPDRGIATIQVSGSSFTSFKLDTYYYKYELRSLEFNPRITSKYGASIEFIVSGDKNPSSNGFSIKLDSMLYSQFDLAEIMVEELNSSINRATRYVVGR